MADKECTPLQRVCRLCAICKPLADFYKNKNCKTGGGVDSKCKSCHKAQSARLQLTEKSKARKAKWAADKWRSDEEYRKRLRKLSQEFFGKDENKIKQAAKQRQRRADNPERSREIKKSGYQRAKSNPLFMCAARIRARIREAFVRRGYRKEGSTAAILGCTYEEFARHIERQFTRGMSWDKMGSEIHLDHIMPIASATSIEEVIALNHFTNIRPLWAEENIRKRDKMLFLL